MQQTELDQSCQETTVPNRQQGSYRRIEKQAETQRGPTTPECLCQYDQ
jgi:hypothetical protein